MQMREQVAAARRLPHKLAAKRVRVELDQHEILLPAEVLGERSRKLPER